ncbi:hypothetical protein MACJ_001699 [Theileria orientalis]|uniref:Uncharacterized protein n=1 Tax=Theileria orientalis TaxID=68886 RepID=A0A976M930_THEOR|nr:hypothetical protein MACJ_001699 [Theileria orientalis]
MDMDYVKQMCCNLQQQQIKINETYEELMNTLNLKEKIEELEEKIEKKEEELKEVEKEKKEYEKKIEIKEIEIENYKRILMEQGIEMEEMKCKMEKVKNERERVRKVGNIIIGTHNQQFIKLLTNMNRLLEFIEYYTINEGEDKGNNSGNSSVYDVNDTNNNGYHSMCKDVTCTNSETTNSWLNSKVGTEVNTTTSMGYKEESTNTTNEKSMASKSSLELLVDINSKFVKVSVNVMRLLSKLDHEILNNYINNTDFTEDIDNYYQIMNADSDLRDDDLGTCDDKSNDINDFNINNEYNNFNDSNEQNDFSNDSGYTNNFYSNGNGSYNTIGYNYNSINTDNNHSYGNYGTNYGSYNGNNIYFYQLPNISNRQPAYSTPLTGCKLTSKNTRTFSSSTQRTNSNKSNKDDSKSSTPTVYQTNKGNVRRIVTTFRPQFNSLFQPIPLHNGASNSMIRNKDHIKYNRTIFQPIHRSNNRSNTNYSEGSCISSLSTDREGNEGMNREVNKERHLDIYSRRAKELNTDLEGTTMKVNGGGNVCNKERERDTHEVKGVTMELEYEGEELQGDEYDFQVPDSELKQDKYSEDDTPILKLMSI